MKETRQGLLVLGTMVALVVFLNYGYFSLQIQHLFSRPKVEASLVSPQEMLVLREPNRVMIQSLGIDAPLIYTDAKTEAGFQEALRNGVVHYPGTAKPGELGNAYYFGHSSDYLWSKGNYKTVFALLTKIEIGSEIVVTDEKGRPYVYRALETRIVSPKDLSVLDQYDNKRRLLSLQTSYPIGSALKRFIVLAELGSAPTSTAEKPKP